jgi:hypothetical protein
VSRSGAVKQCENSLLPENVSPSIVHLRIINYIEKNGPATRNQISENLGYGEKSSGWLGSAIVHLVCSGYIKEIPSRIKENGRGRIPGTLSVTIGASANYLTHEVYGNVEVD